MKRILYIGCKLGSGWPLDQLMMAFGNDISIEQLSASDWALRQTKADVIIIRPTAMDLDMESTFHLVSKLQKLGKPGIIFLIGNDVQPHIQHIKEALPNAHLLQSPKLRFRQDEGKLMNLVRQQLHSWTCRLRICTTQKVDHHWSTFIIAVAAYCM